MDQTRMIYVLERFSRLFHVNGRHIASVIATFVSSTLTLDSNPTLPIHFLPSTIEVYIALARRTL